MILGKKKEFVQTKIYENTTDEIDSVPASFNSGQCLASKDPVSIGLGLFEVSFLEMNKRAEPSHLQPQWENIRSLLPRD
jgi:hypothetical protein